MKDCLVCFRTELSEGLKRNRLLRILGLAVFLIGTPFFQYPVYGHTEKPGASYEIGLREKQGQTIPLDLTFNDESGHPVTFRQLIRMPAILALVYYHCPNVCSLLLQNLAEALNKLPAEPGKDYILLAASFDEREKPDLALQRKKFYRMMVGKPFPEEGWRFLTGDEENIRRLTDAVGFHFKREGEDFEHPVALIILSPKGKVIRYLYGTEYLPFDIKMALLEASEERVGPTISKALRFCFSYDPKGKKYVFNTLKITGTATLFFALLFITFLVFKGRKRQP